MPRDFCLAHPDKNEEMKIKEEVKKGE
jgi:hypothetical protein